MVNQGCALTSGALIPPGLVFGQVGNKIIFLVFLLNLCAGSPGFQGFRDFGHPNTFL